MIGLILSHGTHIQDVRGMNGLMKEVIGTLPGHKGDVFQMRLVWKQEYVQKDINGLVVKIQIVGGQKMEGNIQLKNSLVQVNVMEMIVQEKVSGN